MKAGPSCVVSGRSRGWSPVVVRLTWLAFLVAPGLTLVGGDLSHTPLACVAVGDHAVVRADLEPGTPATSVRVLFRLVGSPEEYYVELRNREGSKYTGILPSPVKEGDTIRYSVVVRGERAEMLRTPQHYAKVTALCPAPKSDAERRAEKNIVVGYSRGDQANFLAGFSCEGVIAKISPTGELSSLYGCKDGTLARFGPPAKGAGPTAQKAATSTSTSYSSPSVLDASRSMTASVSRAPLSSNGLVIGGTNTVGVTAGVLNDVPISSCRPR